MRPDERKDNATLASLKCGVAVPLLYYGAQLVAAPFFPDFSILGTTASELGSDHSTRPAIFNAGAILTGAAALVASVGFLRSLRHLGANPILTWAVVVAIAATGLSCVWSGYFPLPDPRHGGHPALLIAMISVPLVLPAALGAHRASVPVKAYFAATIGLLFVMVPIMSGMTGLATHTYRGLFQRVFALTVFMPIGVGAYILARRMSAAPSELAKPEREVSTASPALESR